MVVIRGSSDLPTRRVNRPQREVLRRAGVGQAHGQGAHFGRRSGSSDIAPQVRISVLC
jgi:hypothetical protein